MPTTVSSLERSGRASLDIDHEWTLLFNHDVIFPLRLNIVRTMPLENSVSCVRFSHDGKYIAMGSGIAVHIYDIDTGAKFRSFTDHSSFLHGHKFISSICFSPDGKYLVSCASGDSLINIWDIQRGIIHKALRGHTDRVHALDFTRDGTNVVSGSSDKTVRLWSARTGSNTNILTCGGRILCVAFSQDCNYIAAGSVDGTISVWVTGTGRPMAQLKGPDGHLSRVYGISFSHDGKYLISCGFDRTIKQWQLGAAKGATDSIGGQCIKTFEENFDYVHSIAFTADDAWIISSSTDCVKFWDPVTGASSQLISHTFEGLDILFSTDPSRRYFATCSSDNALRIWSYFDIR
ncbi:NACHT domain protein [Colletotrichum tofieldiae]|nr:NACHT domain protein [Colletotrichum tofieldiae]